MRTIERSTSFRRDFKREMKGGRRAALPDELPAILAVLAADKMLDPRYKDHALSGSWAGYRECHIRPDLLLIYRKAGDTVLQLARLGSHSELFG
jgi:mRNA interferase YafQ